MRPNPDWNYGYLRVGSSYGEAGKGAFSFDPISAIVQATSGAVTSYYTYKTAREQGEADDRANRIAMRQQAGQSNAGWETLLLLSSKEQEAKRISGDTAVQTAAQSEIIKNVLLGVAVLGVIGALGYGIYVATKD